MPRALWWCQAKANLRALHLWAKAGGVPQVRGGPGPVYQQTATPSQMPTLGAQSAPCSCLLDHKVGHRPLMGCSGAWSPAAHKPRPPQGAQNHTELASLPFLEL